MWRSGTVLGLALAWGTVKDHNGYINVESEEEKGSTFTIYFPVTRKNSTGKSASTAAFRYMGKGQSVLFVDDIKDQPALATEMLHILNY
jgi:two-component system cell cycle sensor histidine kinase/response regulator CckA